MTGLLFWIVLGAFLAFVVPPVIPNRFRSPFANVALRVLGGLMVIYAILSTSFVHVPDGGVGKLFRVYGGAPLTNGRIVAVNGENGPQARIFTPGFKFELLVNVFYDVSTDDKEVKIPQGKIGKLVAKDGAPLRPGQAFADPFPAAIAYQMLDAQVFLKNGGQRGSQLTVLAPGTYRLNTYLWDVVPQDAKEIAAGFVGVVKSNAWADVNLGPLQSTRPANCDAVKRAEEGEGNLQHLSTPVVPVGCIGVWEKSLPPGEYYFNPDAYSVTEIDTRAQVWTYAGGYKRATIALTVDAKGEIVQDRVEEDVPLGTDNADKAVFVKMEGWDVPLELRVVAQVSPEDAACVVAGVGTLKQVEDRVLTPSIRAITRDVAGGTYEVTEARIEANGKPALDKEGKPIQVTINRPTKVLDLINQRPLIEGEIERRIRPEGAKSCVTIREVRLGEPAIPPELLVAVRRQQLATQLAEAFIQEKLAQEKRVDSEKAKATADQQGQLVQADIEVQRSERLKVARLNEGEGERDKLTAIATGQKAQTEVLGTDATVRLRQFELLLGTLAAFFEKHPDVLTSALSNAQKFVPQIQVGGANDNAVGGLLSAILGQSLSKAVDTPALPANK